MAVPLIGRAGFVGVRETVFRLKLPMFWSSSNPVNLCELRALYFVLCHIKSVTFAYCERGVAVAHSAVAQWRRLCIQNTTCLVRRSQEERSFGDFYPHVVKNGNLFLEILNFEFELESESRAFFWHRL
jgi:hypothetical protein